MDILAYFQQTLSPADYDRLIKSRHYKKGTYIYVPPNKPAEMFQVRSGVIKIGSYSEDGQEVCYDLLFKQEVFGNLRYLNGQFFEFAKALTDCTVICIDLSFYKKMIVHDPVISDWFNLTTIQRWCRMETRLFKICSLSPFERIRAIYSEFEGIIKDPKGKAVFVPDLLSIVDIAQMTGISRQTVSKLIKSIENSEGNKHHQLTSMKSRIIKNINKNVTQNNY